MIIVDLFDLWQINLLKTEGVCSRVPIECTNCRKQFVSAHDYHKHLPCGRGSKLHVKINY